MKYRYLGKVNCREDLRGLSDDELVELCGELREEIICAVAKSGGHLASSLGVVELTVALHKVFDAKTDRLVFDVGHQAYAHKLLTGRLDRFCTLREYGGLSGFPDPAESTTDAFRVGHASTSVSAALGLARARTLTGGSYNVVAVLGDGALTGGLAYEALVDAGQSDEPLLVILNDNDMSIDRSVGGVERLLGDLRLRPGYTRFKNKVRQVTGRSGFFYNLIHKIKSVLKNLLLRNNVFEAYGFTYLGPVDGYDLPRLCNMLEQAKTYKGPVLLHVLTQKGKGYPYAEEDPTGFHGPSGFNVENGELAASSENFSGVFGRLLCELAEKDERICAITAAMCSGTGLDGFARAYPNRFFDVGIAEEHAATMAAGLAAGGMTPVFAVYSTFAQRCYDMLLHDIALGGQHVVLAVDRAGLVGKDGATHQGVFDVSFLSTVPGMTVYAPASFGELAVMLKEAVCFCRGPVAVRYPRGGEGRWKEVNCAAASVIRKGSAVTLVGYGTMTNTLLDAADAFPEGTVEILKLGRICPLDTEAVLASAMKTGRLIVVEDCVERGSVGEALAAAVAKAGLNLAVKLMNLGEQFIPHGDVKTLQREYSIDAAAVEAAIRSMTEAGGGKAET